PVTHLLLSTFVSLFCSSFFSCSGDPRDLPPFPTRRSSDLSGVPPARRMPSFILADKRRRWKLHGPISVHVLAMPMIGLRRSSSVDRKSTTSELQSRENLVCRLLLEKKKKKNRYRQTSAHRD